VQIVLLGTAAGGGFPQWNCWCPPCRVARAEPARAHPRTQSSVAVSSNGIGWFLVNASPDIHGQIKRLRLPPSPHYPPVGAAGPRQLPIEAVVFTDAELDHSLGLLSLREAGALTVYATDAVTHVFEHDTRILPITRVFAAVKVISLPLDRAIPLRGSAGRDSGLSVKAFAVPGHAPRFARHPRAGGLTVGLLIRETENGGTLAYIPGCAALDQSVLEHLSRAQIVLFDGTFWSDDEMAKLEISPSTARSMGHLPISGTDGSLAVMAHLPARIRVYTHINNTNPILIEDSRERQAVREAGVIVGDDGLTFHI
jgi:pyrroloquinoline quinone biosynthesis protein B